SRSDCSCPNLHGRLDCHAISSSDGKDALMSNLKKYLRDPARLVRKFRWSSTYSRATRREVTVDTWNGRLTFDCTDRFIGRNLYMNLEFEREGVTAASQFLEREGLRSPARDVVLDVGANIGMIAIALVKHGWFRRAIAFEPEPVNFRLLEHNV